jgi:hypothetical protein
VGVTTAFKRLVDLPGVTVVEVDFSATKVVVGVRLRSRRLICPACEFTTKARYDMRPVISTAAPRSGQMAPGDTGGPSPDRLPGARGPHRGCAVCPRWFSFHPRLRGPGRLVGHHDGQDRAASPRSHRLGHRRADHRAGDRLPGSTPSAWTTCSSSARTRSPGAKGIPTSPWCRTTPPGGSSGARRARTPELMAHLLMIAGPKAGCVTRFS